MSPDALGAGAIGAAALIAVTHTALGPDHYLPFVALAEAQRWSLRRTLVVTAGCGLGHLGASLVLASLGLLGGAALGELEALQLVRGSFAGWALSAFGAAYLLWGLRRGLRERRGLGLHAHGDQAHVHTDGGHHHHHAQPRHALTSWSLFLIFVLGPCEPLMPLFLVPASQGRWTLAGAMALVFAVATLGTMLAMTALALRGLERLPLAPLERWMHVLCGAVVTLSGVAVLLGA